MNVLTAQPELRIARKSRWERVPGQELRFGGPPPALHLVHEDVLQMKVGEDWVGVPIVMVEPVPPHPHKA